MKGMHQSAASFVLPLIFCASAILVVSEQNVPAQVTTAITSSGLNTQVSAPTLLPSGQITHDITGGTRPGNGPNLFHSFGDFSVGNNHIANFLNDSGLATSNILGRVTGGNISNIFGTIQTTNFGNANLFLMNPAGFLFGPNATVNVGGMMTFTSADYLRLADGARFKAVPNAAADALLSTSPVAAFGFLGSNPGAITVQGSQLSVTNGTGISLVGGDITIQSAQLSAPAGQINLVSVRKPQHPNTGGEINASDLSPSTTSGFKDLGTVRVTNGASINVNTDGVTSGQHGGTILIRSGKLVVSNSSLTADGIWNTSIPPDSPAGSIEVHAEKVTLDHATLSANSDRDNAGQIRFMDLETLNGTASSLMANTLSTRFDSQLNRGSITIGSSETKSIALDSTAINTLKIDASTGMPAPHPGVENPGIALTAKTVNLNGGSLNASAGGHDSEMAGRITLNGNQVVITNTGLFSRDTSGGGGAGTITIQGLMSTDGAPTHAKTVTIDSSSLNVFSVGGPGGTITFHANQVTQNNVTLAANSSSRAGTIDLADVRTLESTNSTLRNEGETKGGTIVLGSLDTRSITLTDTTLSVRGTGGTIEITASKQFQSVGSTLDASSDLANGGTISIRAGHLSVTDGSTVTALGAGPGQDGTIRFEFGKKLTVKDSVVMPDATIISGWDGK